MSDDENYFVDMDTAGSLLIKDIRIFRPTMKITQFWCDDKLVENDCDKILQDAERR